MIAPGKEDSITVQYTTRNKKGSLTKKLSVTTNDPKNKKVTLTTKVNVLAPFAVKPRYVQFGTVEGETSPQSIIAEITKGDGGPLDLKINKINRSSVKCELRELEKGTKYEMEIWLEPPVRRGKLVASIELLTGVKEAPKASIPIFAAFDQEWKKPVEPVASAN